jgi:hypothetical protein
LIDRVGLVAFLFAGVSVLVAVGCGTSGSHPAPVNSAAFCAKFANDSSFDANSDQDLARVHADGDPRFVTESEASAISPGESQAQVFCRLGFYFTGEDYRAAPPECESGIWGWAIGDPTKEPDLLSKYPTVSACFHDSRVKYVKRSG